MSDLVGKKFGKYELVERLGRGGMADVYKAYQTGLDRFVAVKTMHDHLADSGEFISRFRREAQSVAKLRHPHILQVIDFDSQDGVNFMVMEYIEGETLQDYILEKGKLSTEEALHIAGQVADALDYAHQKGMIHRDIKPANIMFTTKGYTDIVLTDFGIARILDASNLTMSGMMVGTPAYMSPESGRGEKADERADIYGVGVVLYEMLIGQVPYQADTPFGIIMKHINEPLPLPREFDIEVPDPVEMILLRAMMKDAVDRYQTAAELSAAVHDAQVNLSQYTSTGISTPTASIVTEKPAPPQSAAARHKAPAASPRAQPASQQKSSLPYILVGSGAVLAILVVAAALIIPRLSSDTNSEAPLPTLDARLADESEDAESSDAPVVNPAAAESSFQNGMTFAERGDFATAIVEFTNAIEQDPNPAHFYAERGWANLAIEESEDAAADFTQAILRNPDDVDAYWGRAESYLQDDSLEAALVDYSKIIELEPEDPEAYRNRALIYLELDQPEQALEDLGQAIELEPENIISYEDRGWINLQLGRGEDSLEDFSQAIELEPEIAWLYLGRGWAYFSLDNDTGAIADMNHALELIDDEPTFHLDIADVYFMIEEYELSLQHYQQVLNLTGDPDEYVMGRIAEIESILG